MTRLFFVVFAVTATFCMDFFRSTGRPESQSAAAVLVFRFLLQSNAHSDCVIRFRASRYWAVAAARDSESCSRTMSLSEASFGHLHFFIRRNFLGPVDQFADLPFALHSSH